MRERVPAIPKSKNGRHKLAASPPTLRAGLSNFGGVEVARAYLFLAREAQIFWILRGRRPRKIQKIRAERH